MVQVNLRTAARRLLEAHEKMVREVDSMPDSSEKHLLQLACCCLHPNRMERPQDAAELQRMLEGQLQARPGEIQ